MLSSWSLGLALAVLPLLPQPMSARSLRRAWTLPSKALSGQSVIPAYAKPFSC